MTTALLVVAVVQLFALVEVVRRLRRLPHVVEVRQLPAPPQPAPDRLEARTMPTPKAQRRLRPVESVDLDISAGETLRRQLRPGLHRWHVLPRIRGKASAPVTIRCGDVDVVVTNEGAEVDMPGGEAVFSCHGYKGCARLIGTRLE